MTILRHRGKFLSVPCVLWSDLLIAYVNKSVFSSEIACSFV